MPGYIVLYKFTQQGASQIAELPRLIAAQKALAEKMGARPIGVWLTFGEYDMVAIGEAPDDLTAAALAALSGSRGNVTTRSMRAFSEDEIPEILKRMATAGQAGGPPSS